MLEVKLMNEEQMAKSMALSLNLMVEQIKKQGFDVMLHPVKQMSCMLTNQTAKHFIESIEDNLWDPESQEGKEKLRNSIMTTMAMMDKGAHEITVAIRNYDFEKLNNILLDELEDIDFDFTVYSEYIKQMKTLVAKLRSDFSLDTLNLTEQSLDLEL